MAFEGPPTDPSMFTISVENFSYADAATGDSFTMPRFSIVAKDFVLDNDGELSSGTMTLDGTASGTVSGNPVDSELDDFKIVLSSGFSGETMSLSGRIRASCLDGWITIATETPVFSPNGADCPTKGKVVITANGNEIEVTVQPDAGIAVSFNGDLVQTYDDCNDVEGLCTG